MEVKYYVEYVRFKPQEVTLEDYIRAEQSAGFTGPGHYMNPKEVATQAFSDGKISGRVEYVQDEGCELDFG